VEAAMQDEMDGDRAAGSAILSRLESRAGLEDAVWLDLLDSG